MIYDKSCQNLKYTQTLFSCPLKFPEYNRAKLYIFWRTVDIHEKARQIKENVDMHEQERM